MREKILAVIEKNSRIDIKDLAVLLGESEIAVANEIADMEKEHIICGYHTLINWDNTSEEKVSALIEVKVTPQRGMGFDKLAERIYEEAKAVGLYALDAPVTGGDSGAKAGTLTILAGGDREAFDACMPVFEAMGKNINYEGKAGNGQHTKMCNQIAIAGALAGACEAMVYAKNTGLNVDTMLKSISTGAAGSAQMNNVASKAAKDDYAPGFFLKHFIKDMGIADEEALAADTRLGVLEDVLGMAKKLESEGMGDLGTQALIKYYKW